MKKEKTIKKVLYMIHKLCPSLIPLIVVSQIINTAIPFISIIFSSIIIDGLVTGASYEYIFRYALWLILGNGGAVLLHQALEKVVNVRSYNIQNMIWNEIAIKSLVMDYELLEKKETMEQIEQAKKGMQAYGGTQNVCVMLAKVIGILVSIVYSIVLIVPVFLVSETKESIPWFLQSGIGIVVLAGMLAIQLGMLYRSNKIYGKLQQENFKKNKEGNAKLGVYTTPIIEYAKGKDIRMIRLDIPYVKRLREGSRKIAESVVPIHRKCGRLAIINFVFSMLFTLSCYIYVGVKALLGMITVGNVTKYVSAFTKLGVALVEIVDIYVRLQISCSYLSHFVNFMEIENHKYDGTLPIEKRDDGEYEFEFRNVTFYYPNMEEPVLDNVSFKIKIGKKMALVGPNGAGKTTFIKLLCRLYDPTEGQILLNGIDIRYYDYNEYIQLFSVVFQDFKLFSFSIAENVAVSKEYNEEKVRECLKKAGFGERLETMELDIHTNLYQLEEDGIEISGGEAQKIAIARALYKDAPLVILDEPTSALDPISEYEIYKSFDELVEAKTAIYISHRMSSCRFCEQILVFDKGGIIQQGSHEELVKDTEGLYYEMWTAQAQYYQ